MIKVECRACDGTGVYIDKHFPKPDGVALVCRECQGKGYHEHKTVYGEFTEFTHRKIRSGVRWVWPSMDVWSAKQDWQRYAVSYEAFQRGQMPVKP